MIVRAVVIEIDHPEAEAKHGNDGKRHQPMKQTAHKAIAAGRVAHPHVLSCSPRARRAITKGIALLFQTGVRV